MVPYCFRYQNNSKSIKTKTHHHIFSQKYCQWFSYSQYLQFFISKYFSLRSLSIIIFHTTCMLEKGWDLYLQEKIYCFTVRFTRVFNLNRSLFLYIPNKTDRISNEICISNILKIHSSILHHKPFTRGHLKKQMINILCLSFTKSTKGEIYCL